MLRRDDKTYGLCLALGLWACVAEPPSGSHAQTTAPVSGIPSQGLPHLKLGQTFDQAGILVKLVSQRVCGGVPLTDVPQDGYHIWAAELEITNRSKDRLPVGAFHATIKDSDGFSYTTRLTGCDNVLESRFLAPGESLRGSVPFELPTSLTSATLSYGFSRRGQTPQEAVFQITF